MWSRGLRKFSRCVVGHSEHCPNSADVHNRVYERLLTQYTPLIHKVIRSLGFHQKNHDHEGLESDDAFQAGSLGLWFATMGYDPEKASFVTHAYNCITWEILEEMRRTGWSRGRVSVPTNYEDFEFTPSRIDIEAEASTAEELALIDEFISEMDIGRRTVFQGLMRHQGRNEGRRNCGNPPLRPRTHDQGNGPHKHIADALGVSRSRVYQLRTDIRKRLRRLH